MWRFCIMDVTCLNQYSKAWVKPLNIVLFLCSQLSFSMGRLVFAWNCPEALFLCLHVALTLPPHLVRVSSLILNGCFSALFLLHVVEVFTLNDLSLIKSNMLVDIRVSTTAHRLRTSPRSDYTCGLHMGSHFVVKLGSVSDPQNYPGIRQKSSLVGANVQHFLKDLKTRV